ncbi:MULTISPECIES: TetR/AcrR family transcriptional regulator [Brevibacillus]|jgi:AcrR family transcriptional regulator|uniref:TetR/AcrR family transcriptional regulator n=1 Tax=Brevibacillus TaxID=55080 RepID=UPI000F0814E6|nr:TetR/AcrR family transcriptional regulator [Brevibacillus borstelensis]MBE5397264.1 TetR/AcrR family transcriptional regulator [Brevibacillus borstelensis]MCM3592947.1 TetR/AcrR family transcriptional regulator [Brevibacillus borstelensis]MED1873323.1 TetR/AcrR family transcriptional regulator [Brevibacillus borstelensis]MED1885301.1 TetR/AcrR family transcriptional regulator [Brevibacillus borstelensis]NOU53372.1 TetR/AcrR family transcriptional regulator [Brevibacillus borstelensis]
MSPRTKEQCEELREKRIQQIMEAAGQIYFEKGLLFDIRDVAKKAGLGYGTVYHYYSNKNSLVSDLLDRGFELSEALTSAFFSRQEKSAELLDEFCAGLLRLWLEAPAAFIVYKWAAENFVGMEEQLRRTAKQRFDDTLYQPLLECITQMQVQSEALATGTDPGRIANFIIGTMVGCFGISMYHKDADFSPEGVLLMIRKSVSERRLSESGESKGRSRA